MRTCLLAVLSFVLLSAAPAASGDGGPSPGAVTGWDGVLASNGASRYVALSVNGSTLVARVEVEGGRVVDYRTIRGFYGIPLVALDGSTGGLSADGSTLVLAPFSTPVQSGQVSRFAVLDPDRHLRTRKLVVLRGSFSYDAISPNGHTLYLIQYLSFASPNGAITYRVRAYDLVRGKLVPGSIVDRREPDEQMQGSPVTRATSSDGGWAYTLYARQVGKPFVHALDTRHRRAFCVDIPWAGYNQQTLNGIHLRAARGRVVLHDYSGTLAAIDTHTWKVKSYRKP